MPTKTVLLTATIVMSVAAACSEQSSSTDGAEGGSCYPNGTCNTGLVCLTTKICAKPSADAKLDGTAVRTVDGKLLDGRVTKLDGKGDGMAAPSVFSFFVMSLERIQGWGGSEGLGGNLGGLAGADAKCQEAAAAVGSTKTWRAFLSVTNDGNGNAVNAIDRIGNGPWYDVRGLLLATDKTGLLKTRPNGATDVVWNDGWKDWPFNQCLTTELGNCNHSYGDSHDTLTGSNRQGKLYSTDSRYTCNDWKSTSINVQLPIGHTWPRQLNSTNDEDANWIYAHTCNGCGANINLTNTMEQGVGGDGGYGAWYCFAID